MTVRILHGDCRDVLRTLSDESVHCVVTSPPYWGLRDYGVDGQIGLESDFNDYVATMVQVSREVRRVLRSDGTLWLNLGDSYASGGRKTRDPGQSKIHPSYEGDGYADGLRPTDPQGIKPKDLIGVPWRVAFALRADGWWLRQEIIWAKDNPMPESVTDRCTKSHEQIFLLSKSPRYYFDQEAISEPCSPNTHARLSQDVQDQIGSERAHAGAKTNGNMKAVGRKSWKGSRLDGERDLTIHPNVGRNRGSTPKTQPAGLGIKNNESFAAACSMPVERRNKRSVWNVSTQPFSEAHFATFPPALIEPCILAGCSKGGTVLDPFGGAGTTGLVADRLGRDAVLIELNPAYSAMARARVTSDSPLFAEVATV